MEEKEGLSPEELAAMEEGDQDQTDELLESVAGGEEAAGGEEEDGGTEGGEAAGAAAGAGEGGEGSGEGEGATAAAAAKPAALAVPEVGAIEVPQEIPAVRFVFRDDGKVLPEFAPQFQELDAKYDAGSLTLTQYNEQRDALKAEMNNAKSDAQLWQAECETFWRHNKDWQPGTVLFDMLNGEVRRLAALEAAANLSGIELIYTAQARVQKAIDGVRGSARPSPKKEEPAPAARPASPRPAAAAHALGAMPAAAAAEVGKGEFAHLDSLQGLELERAVAALSSEQRERWAAES